MKGFFQNGRVSSRNARMVSERKKRVRGSGQSRHCALSGNIKAIFLYFPVERSQADVQQACGFGFISAGMFKHKPDMPLRSEEHTSELQSLMRISYAVFCLKK